MKMDNKNDTAIGSEWNARSAAGAYSCNTYTEFNSHCDQNSDYEVSRKELSSKQEQNVQFDDICGASNVGQNFVVAAGHCNNSEVPKKIDNRQEFDREINDHQDVDYRQEMNDRPEMDARQEMEDRDEILSLEPKESSTFVGPLKISFKLKQNDNGNILIVHHTVEEHERLIRVRMAACCFNKNGTTFFAVDKRGNIFIFDLVCKKYWRSKNEIPKVSTISHSITRDEFLIGTKFGQLALFDIERDQMKTMNICENVIHYISFPGQPLQPSSLALVHAGNAAIIINLDTFKATHRLDVDEISPTLKFACFIPHSEQIFTCFTDDTLHIWSGVTLNTLRIVNPIKMRERKLKWSPKCITEISLRRYDDTFAEEFQTACYEQQDFSDGIILAYAFSPDASLLCLSTLDKYMLLLDVHTYNLQRVFKLTDFVITSCKFLSKPKDNYLFVMSSNGQVLLIDFRQTEFILSIHLSDAYKLHLSPDEKLLAVLMDTGEAYIWSVGKLYNFIKGQQYCKRLMEDAFKENKPFPIICNEKSAVSSDLKEVLKPNRLRAILVEFGRYPSKYRGVIWSSLLRLPCNSTVFQQLVKLPVPNTIKECAAKLKIKEDSHRRLFVKILSCLAHWCQVFAYSEFMPSLIFPFTQVYPRNAMIAFELCVSLLLNHFALWFEFHPLEPANYLALCANVLQHFDKKLFNFFTTNSILPKYYAWSMLSNGFSVVLNAEQWLSLWDHIISYPTYFPVFCVVAYNILQREILLRLPDADAVKYFFCEQNPIDVDKLIRKACHLMLKCPPDIHPKRYMREYMAIPKGVYPKFLNFPRKLVNKQEEELEQFRQERRVMEARMHELEVEEVNMLERLQNVLNAEEHAKRIKEMEELYHNTLKQEEERIANQRQMLDLYQKEIHNRKGEVLTALHESERRRKRIEMEKEVDSLMHTVQRERQRSASYLQTAEHEKRSQDLELLAKKNLTDLQSPTLSQKYHEKIENLNKQRELLKDSINKKLRKPDMEITKSRQGRLNLDDIEEKINEIQKEFCDLTKAK